jgi:hypothetical protein
MDKFHHTAPFARSDSVGTYINRSCYHLRQTKIDRVTVSATTSINGAYGGIALGDVTNVILPPNKKEMYSLKSVT